MNGLLPMGSYPVEVAGRNRLWRKIVMEAIRGDPEWKKWRLYPTTAVFGRSGELGSTHDDQPGFSSI
jgi:hypothetical protein